MPLIGAFLLEARVAAKWRMAWNVNGFTFVVLHKSLRYLGYFVC